MKKLLLLSVLIVCMSCGTVRDRPRLTWKDLETVKDTTSQEFIRMKANNELLRFELSLCQNKKVDDSEEKEKFWKKHWGESIFIFLSGFVTHMTFSR